MRFSINNPIKYEILRSALDLLKDVSKPKKDQGIYTLFVWIKLKVGEGEGGN